MIDGGPAFPNLATIKSICRIDETGNPELEHQNYSNTGMSLRAWLAGQALSGFDILGLNFWTIKTPEYTMPWVAEQCVAAADAIIAELAKPRQESCEHGIADGEFCDPCNREYKLAAVENGIEERERQSGRKGP